MEICLVATRNWPHGSTRCAESRLESVVTLAEPAAGVRAVLLNNGKLAIGAWFPMFFADEGGVTAARLNQWLDDLERQIKADARSCPFPALFISGVVKVQILLVWKVVNPCNPAPTPAGPATACLAGVIAAGFLVFMTPHISSLTG